MAVLIGSARINELNNAGYGVTHKAGDQTSKEVSTQNWYLHEKGWIMFRAKDAAVREKIAKCMEMACANDHIGYCQPHNLTLYNEAKKYGWDVSKVNVDCETDCSALVRICLLAAGLSDPGAFSTAMEPTVLSNTGKFDKYTDANHTTKSDYLMRGDILVTKTSGHTVVVLSNGPLAGATTAPAPSAPAAPATGTYTVQRGDTLSKIAKAYNTTVEAIVTANKAKYPTITANYIVTGWTLNIGSKQSTYTVQHGDTLSKIAKAYNTTVDAIVSANKAKYPTITANYIVTGWILTV